MRICLVVLLFIVSGVSFAQPPNTSNCGFLKCEQYLADTGGSVTYHSGYSKNRKCALTPSATKVGYWYQQIFPPPATPGLWSYSATNFAFCNCAAQTPLPPGSRFGSSSGGSAHTCYAGCRYNVNGPSVGTPDMTGETGGYIINSGDATWVPDGSNCNPLDQNPPATAEPPPDNCDIEQTCIEAPDPPEYCIEVAGKSICTDHDDGPCSGNSSDGYLCHGNPPPDPPPPPETARDDDNPTEPTEPTASGGPNYVCTGAGSCQIDYYEYTPGGDDDPPLPPPDDESDDPPDYDGGGLPGRCPDGSVPQGGRCPAPVTCPGGVTPVNGSCPANSQCPIGTVFDGETCSDGTDPNVTCPNGATPNSNGTCPGNEGMCPNGSRPVGGQCSIDSECDPLTDPDQCEGADDNNASGGNTCSSPPSCSGDQILCSQLNQQWRINCSLLGFQSDRRPNDGDAGGEVDASDAWAPADTSDISPLDSSGWLGGPTGGQCPDLPAPSFMGVTVDLAQMIPCSAMYILSLLILAGGLAQGAYIIGRG